MDVTEWMKPSSWYFNGSTWAACRPTTPQHWHHKRRKDSTWIHHIHILTWWFHIQMHKSTFHAVACVGLNWVWEHEFTHLLPLPLHTCLCTRFVQYVSYSWGCRLFSGVSLKKSDATCPSIPSANCTATPKAIQGTSAFKTAIWVPRALYWVAVMYWRYQTC